MKNTTKSSDSEEEVIIPDHLHGSNEKADFRKLSPEGQAVGKVEDSTAVHFLCVPFGFLLD